MGVGVARGVAVLCAVPAVGAAGGAGGGGQPESSGSAGSGTASAQARLERAAVTADDVPGWTVRPVTAVGSSGAAPAVVDVGHRIRARPAACQPLFGHDALPQRRAVPRAGDP